MAGIKTQKNDLNVITFLESIENPQRKKDCFAVLGLMKKITNSEPSMWGTTIIGFGSYHYKYASGREGNWFITGFSPRKQSLSLYIMSEFSRYEEILNKLGKYKTGKCCLYIKKLEDVEIPALKELISESVAHLKSNK